ncbi:hypothetical protein HBI83_233570 [Parastagonospora nodorum]|nr:hypothetical protein HBI83_233570 [Parastagonospora nodorum]
MSVSNSSPPRLALSLDETRSPRSPRSPPCPPSLSPSLSPTPHSLLAWALTLPPTTSGTPSRHARADRQTLHGTMARAYIASSTTTTTTTTTCLVSPTTDTQRPASPPPPAPFNIPKPFGAPIFPEKPQNYVVHSLRALPERLSAHMPLDLAIVPRAHWLSRVRSCLRLLIIVLSGAVVCMLVHTLEIYRGNRYLDLRSGEIPMTWPAHTNLAPTIVLLAIAAANFLASVAILSLSLKRSFRRPIRSRDAYRIIAGSFGVILWITAIVVFHLLDKASKASLGRYSCTNKNVLSNGRFQYRAVCEEQGVAFYTAIGAATAEILTLATLAVSAIRSVKNQEPAPMLQIRDKKHSISSGSQLPYKPRKRSPSTL